MSSPTPQHRNILLLGAGELGTSILTALSLSLSNRPNTPLTLTLAVRTPSNYAPLTRKHPNLTTIPLDLASPSEILIPTFATYDIIISCTGFGQDPSAVTKLAHEILGAGKLKRENEGKGGKGEKGEKGDGDKRLWFFPWQFGVDYDTTGAASTDSHALMPLFGAQLDVRNLLRQHAASSNVKYTIVSTGIFMSFLFEAFWSVVVRKSQDKSEEQIWNPDTNTNSDGNGKIVIRALRDWAHKITVTDVQDIGTMVARIIGDDVAEADNGIVYVAGDTVSYAELAAIVSEWAGEEVEREAWSVPHLEAELAKDPDDGIKKYRLVFARDGVCWDKERTLNHRLGIPVMDIRTFLAGKTPKREGV